MKVSDERKNDVFDKTSGKCHLCHKNLAFKNYGVNNARGSWEIEHSKPRSKGNGSNYSIRSKNGVRKAPLSEKNRDKEIFKNTAIGGFTGAAIGSFLGTEGAVIGGILGALFGRQLETDQ